MSSYLEQARRITCVSAMRKPYTFANSMVALGNNERERTGRDGAAVTEQYVKQFLLGLILVSEVDVYVCCYFSRAGCGLSPVNIWFGLLHVIWLGFRKPRPGLDILSYSDSDSLP